MHWSWLSEYDHHPADWHVVKLGKHINVIAGQSPDGELVNQSRTGLPFLQGNAEFGEMHPTPEFWCGEPKKRCSSGDTLISVRAPVGEMNRADQTYGLGRGLAALRATGMDADFLFYGMQFWRKVFQRVAQGTTFDAITERHFRQMWVCMPADDNEQKAIALAVKLVDESMLAAHESIAKAERLEKGLMQQLLSGRLKPDGTERPQSDFRSDPKFGLVPKGWIVEKGWKLSEKITKGQSPKWQGFDYTTSGMLFVTSENVRDGFLDISAPKYLPVEFNDKIKGSELRCGDVLINLVGASIGRSCIFDSDHEPANVNQAVCVFRPKPGIVSRYLAYYLRLPSTQNRLLSSQVETARSNLSLADLRRLRFVLPKDEHEQNTIAECLHHITRLIDVKKNKIVALQSLKKSLMQQLLTGRIRLPLDSVIREAKS